MILYAALAEDEKRKPCIGMWEEFVADHAKSRTVDLTASFFVGDAAGRHDGWKLGRRADHASTDRKFAINVGLRFFTPEQFFLGEAEVEYPKDPFDPQRILQVVSAPLSDVVLNLGTAREVVVFVGSPASGKSTFYRRYLEPKKYTLISQVFHI
jgi:bifunctional polynucleotide phosphatase/kinase